MRVLTLVPNQTGYAPGQRGSIELWEKILKPEGIELDYAPFETQKLRQILYHGGNAVSKALEMIKGYAQRINLLKNLDDYDAVFIYREAALLGPAFLEKMVARKKPIIYQIDDPLYIPYKSIHNGYLSYLKFFGKIKEIMRISKVVMANSTHIRDYALQYNKNVWQVPSVVDEEKFTYEPFNENLKNACIGWSGSIPTVPNLQMVEKPLQRLSGKCDMFFIGGEDFNLENVEYKAQKWKLETEVEDLRKMHIGMIPLPDSNPWNKHKFIMKSAQYMTLGIVPVGTPIASNLEVINHGENGFLAATDDEWYESLNTLISDAGLRNKMSKQAAKDAHEKYTLKANTEKIITAFRAALK